MIMPNKLNYLLLACLILTQLSCKSNNTKVILTDSTKIEKTTTHSAKNQLSNLEMLQGKWQSTEDKSNILIFENNQKKEIADGLDIWNNEAFVLSNKCENELDKDNENPKENDKYISVAQSDMCWYIVELNATTLSLLVVGGKGNTLTYNKMINTKE